ncbi:hypothetical protein C8R43DRAFT_1152141 [Mycena crocata]|nr:hypothetical protein C8R43DRAFT_1152141 [Mycena crocata]
MSYSPGPRIRGLDQLKEIFESLKATYTRCLPARPPNPETARPGYTSRASAHGTIPTPPPNPETAHQLHLLYRVSFALPCSHTLCLYRPCQNVYAATADCKPSQLKLIQTSASHDSPADATQDPRLLLSPPARARRRLLSSSHFLSPSPVTCFPARSTHPSETKLRPQRRPCTIPSPPHTLPVHSRYPCARPPQRYPEIYIRACGRPSSSPHCKRFTRPAQTSHTAVCAVRRPNSPTPIPSRPLALALGTATATTHKPRLVARAAESTTARARNAENCTQGTPPPPSLRRRLPPHLPHLLLISSLYPPYSARFHAARDKGDAGGSLPPSLPLLPYPYLSSRTSLLPLNSAPVQVARGRVVSCRPRRGWSVPGRDPGPCPCPCMRGRVASPRVISTAQRVHSRPTTDNRTTSYPTGDPPVKSKTRRGRVRLETSALCVSKRAPWPCASRNARPAPRRHTIPRDLHTTRPTY